MPDKPFVLVCQQSRFLKQFSKDVLPLLRKRAERFSANVEAAAQA